MTNKLFVLFEVVVNLPPEGDRSSIATSVTELTFLFARSLAIKVKLLVEHIRTQEIILAVNEGKADVLQRYLDVLLRTSAIIKSDAVDIIELIDEKIIPFLHQQEKQWPALSWWMPFSSTREKLLTMTLNITDNTRCSVRQTDFQLQSAINSLSEIDSARLTRNSERSVINSLKTVLSLSQSLFEYSSPLLATSLEEYCLSSHIEQIVCLKSSPMPKQWLCSQCCYWNKEENVTSITSCTRCLEPIIFRSRDHQNLHNAMNKGFVEYDVHTAVVQGEARAGKTSLKSLILSQPYDHLSTSIMEAPTIGNFSVSRFGSNCESKCWTLVEEEEMSEKVMAELQSVAKEPTAPQAKAIPLLTSSSIAQAKENTPGSAMNRHSADSLEQPASVKRSTGRASLPEEDEKEATTAVLKFFERCQESFKVDKLSLHHDWLYFIDSGGQIQFQKLLLAFMPCASVYLLVINLAKSLSDPSSTAMQLHDREINVSKHSLKVEDVLKQLLSAIASTAHQYRSLIADDPSLDLYIEPPPEKLSIIAVATHRDEYDQLVKEGTVVESPQEKEVKLNDIFESVKSTCKLVREDEPPYKILHEVDGRKAKCKEYNDPVVEYIAKKLKAQAYKIKVPLSWHCFGVLLRIEGKKGCGVLSLSYCQSVGDKFKMSPDDVVSALKFFHTLNIMLYYPDSVACDIVFVCLDSLIEIIKDLMILICKCQDNWRAAPSDIRDLISQGLLSVEVLKKSAKYRAIAETFKGFESKVLGVFEDLLIAARLPEEGHFLMPALLPVKDVSDNKPFPNTIPLLYSFENGLPMGLFCAVLVHLLSIKNDWLIIRSSDTCSNYLTLEKYNTKGSNIFVEGLNYFEIYAEYPDFRVAEAVEKAIKVTMRKRNLSEHDKVVRAFHCTCKEGVNHIAKVEGSGHEYVLRCSVTNRSVEIKKAGLWFIKRNLISAPNFTELVSVLANISDKWYELGIALQVRQDVRGGLQQSNHENSIRLIKVLEYWKDNPGEVPYTWQSVIDAMSNPIVGKQNKIKDIRELTLNI